MRNAPILLLLVASCAKSSTTAADGSLSEAECSAPKVGRASSKPVATWTTSCTPRGTLGPNAKPSALVGGTTTTITSEKDLADVYDCKGAPSGLDFTKEVLVVVKHADSPAAAGVDVLDDGQKVTFVQKDRAPCPSQFPPHPGPDQTFAFRVSTAPRTFDRVQCTLKAACN